jgi:hypothetical protein
VFEAVSFDISEVPSLACFGKSTGFGFLFASFE